MSTTTRENMRRELKELAKLAETMGKPSADAVLADSAPIEFPQNTLERPVTPASSSRVSVPPMATPTVPPVFDYAEAKRGSGKRTGVLAVLVGGGLAIALVAGAYVGKSLAGGSTASTAPVDVRGAAATIATPPIVPAAEQPVLPAAAVAPPAQPAAVAVAPKTATPVAAPVVHKHVAPRSAAPAAAPPAKAAVASSTSNTAPAAGGTDAVAAPKAAASPGLSKPAPAKAAAGGGGDSLEDLIRKEVAAQKK
ncbi:MAG TPA: hypothetical protein VII82_13365 [Polyangiaceae bacterium]|jgi:hypothetical protein